MLKKKKLTKQQSILENNLEYLQSQLSSCNINEKDNILSMIAKTQSDLNCFVEKIAGGATIQSRARWMEFGEKSNKYFLSQKKWHRSKNSINACKMKSFLVNLFQSHNLPPDGVEDYCSLTFRDVSILILIMNFVSFCFQYFSYKKN